MCRVGRKGLKGVGSEYLHGKSGRGRSQVFALVAPEGEERKGSVPSICTSRTGSGDVGRGPSSLSVRP
jgi:hypothetical protein